MISEYWIYIYLVMTWERNILIWCFGRRQLMKYIFDVRLSHTVASDRLRVNAETASHCLYSSAVIDLFICCCCLSSVANLFAVFDSFNCLVTRVLCVDYSFTYCALTRFLCDKISENCFGQKISPLYVCCVTMDLLDFWLIIPYQIQIYRWEMTNANP